MLNHSLQQTTPVTKDWFKMTRETLSLQSHNLLDPLGVLPG